MNTVLNTVCELASPDCYRVGGAVFVHAMGSLYAGTVTKVTGRTVTAEYVSGAGVKRSVTANPKVEYNGCLRSGGRYIGPRIVRAEEVK